MHQMRAPLHQPVITLKNPEDILGQFYVAFGQGAGTMRVRREAIAALRRRYFPAIQASARIWPNVAGNVLSLVMQVGRLAALLATQAGRTAISQADFMLARRTIEAGVHRRHQSGGLQAGPFCPHFVEDDEDAARGQDERTPEGSVVGGQDPELFEPEDVTVN